ncbi:hypothetical protein PENANT_c002G11342 [Penicillium antarcticum]|uniref:Uncharacterized protein n=1 Tax=Penicillium antarcticum TaxID=416450 RepID=A0A1V6QKE3_9EURO|nr:uncharacterized protein N7508_008587 [Penicillium antarcticum]KAJ5293766.1 hypothetical protein N7508_008587 [Penicillium antarcticum]OQD89452.1 hypothetical protein PENANT_c002G11342 [Penicillium antarcticum]
MIRCRPTLILLEDIDSLFPIFPLTTDFDKLTLDEQSHDLDLSATDIDLSAHGDSKLSYQLDISSSRGMFASPSPAPPSIASTKPWESLPIQQLHTSPKPKPRPASQSIDPPRPKVTFALSPQEQELHSGRANRSPEEQADDTENRLSNTNTALHVLDSPVTPQLSFLSCGVSSSPATASVPLRDLVLASTMSYEAALAEEVSPVLGGVGEGQLV